MAQTPRVVAELGRPETPEETAARKAESSRVHRSSQTFRNLIAALIVTLGIVAVVVAIVPRGTPAPRDPIDVAAVASRLATSEGRTVVVPAVPAEWTVNAAGIEGDGVAAWTMTYVPGEDAGFLRIAQGFDADEAWPTRVLRGAGVGGTVTIAGIEWKRYDIRDAESAGNVSDAISTQAGSDTILVYGSTSDDDLEKAAASVAADIRRLRTEAAE